MIGIVPRELLFHYAELAVAYWKKQADLRAEKLALTMYKDSKTKLNRNYTVEQIRDMILSGDVTKKLPDTLACNSYYWPVANVTEELDTAEYLRNQARHLIPVQYLLDKKELNVLQPVTLPDYKQEPDLETNTRSDVSADCESVCS